MVFMGNRPASFAARGAAIVPPSIKPTITCQWLTPRKAKKVTALARVMKNSLMLTDPITYLGLLPFEISVLVTSGPHPPPPKESRNPPAPANHPTCFTFWGLFFLYAVVIILIPKNNV